MGWKAWLYFGFTALLTIVLIGIMVYYYQRKRKHKVESPKYRMMEEDDISTKSQAPNNK
jgi:cbb3-type cytochrome oxidase subunit 3